MHTYKFFNRKKFLSLAFACFAFVPQVIAQQKIFISSNAHSHNDYNNPSPFYTAFNAGFGSIEVDIFPVKGILCVAHSKREIQPHRTLKKLYLDPLLKELASDSSRRLKLLVDIKDDYKISLHLFIQEIEPLKKYLSTLHESKSLTILISGKRPPPAEYKNYPDYIFFDDHLTLHHNAAEWERVGQVSLPFTKFSTWRGKGSLEERDEKLLKRTIDSVHHAGKTIRFWAAPDNEASWKMQMKLGVNLIGTDK
ncbi:MAG: alkaline phosphatase, partial [Chitinophagaceae bacterium]